MTKAKVMELLHRIDFSTPELNKYIGILVLTLLVQYWSFRDIVKVIKFQQVLL